MEITLSQKEQENLQKVKLINVSLRKKLKKILTPSWVKKMREEYQEFSILDIISFLLLVEKDSFDFEATELIRPNEPSIEDNRILII